MRSDILVVDDEVDIRQLVAGILEDEGHTTRLAKNSDEALEKIAERRPSLIFLDIWMQGSTHDGLELLDIIKQQNPDLPVVMISGHGNIETAVSAIKRGAYDFIEKPFKADRLVLVTTRALEASQLRREVNELRSKSGFESGVVGSSQAIVQLRAVLERVAKANSRVLITGPSGSGKELTARSMHNMSNRAESPFIVLNAAALEPERWEIELFGTEDHGAGERKVGLLEESHGGTLYIDEVADMPYETQGKILRVLVEQNFTRVGGGARIHVDVRIFSSSSRNLEAAIRDGSFREDLFHRLNVVPIRVPGLAERRTDIPELVDHFVKQIARATGLPARTVGADALAIIQSHDWPGNVRQLRNNIERLMILADGDPDSEITAEMLPAEVGTMLPPIPSGTGAEKLMAMALRDARELFEREYLVAQIERFGGNISKTAEFIGMERSALHRKLKSLGVGANEKPGDPVEA
ncbi:MAG: sigma-54 dependent transcriptional regulator [Fimbriimonadaceae bacterium]|nr:sigma-54 dependent transcriptional regulator [Alphaproteobacteria bacterium]